MMISLHATGYCAKRIISIILLLVFLFSTVGSAQAINDEELHIVLGPEPETLDPAITLTVDVRSYLSHLFEGLTVIDAEGNIKPGCASRWEVNDDATQYIFTMDPSAVWTDGKQVTADDFRFEWLRVLAPETASGWASFLYYIKGAERYNKGECDADDVGISVSDAGELVVELEVPCSFFTSMTAMQPYYPAREDIIESNENWTANAFVSNGPYILEAWNHDQSLVLRKNENFHQKINGEFSRLVFILMEDSSATMNAFESGEVDFVGWVLTVDEMEQVGDVNYCDYTVTKFLSINSKREAFSDVRVRQAISLALNRTVIAELMGEGYLPLCSWLPRGFVNAGVDFRDDAERASYYSAEADLEQALALLEEAGYPNGAGFPEIEYLTNTSSLNIRLGEIVKEQLARIGLTVNIITFEQKVFGEYRRNRDFDIVAASWAAEYPDISSYFYGFQSTDINNYSQFADEQYDALYKEALSTTDPSSRFDLYHRQEELVMDSWYVLPLYSANTSYIASDSLEGFYYDVTDCLRFTDAVLRR